VSGIRRRVDLSPLTTLSPIESNIGWLQCSPLTTNFNLTAWEMAMGVLDLIKLKNGAEEPKVVVAAVTISLNSIWDSGLKGVLAVYDLSQIARGKGEGVSPKTIEFLQGYNLVEQNGRLHETIKNVVLSAVDDEGNLSSPLARPTVPVAGAKQEPTPR
jgi:hypothetical protein